MSYGVNAPWGLRPMMKQGASTFDMVETYALQSNQPATANAPFTVANIYVGDLVTIDATGYVQPFSNPTTSLNNGTFTIGVFMGCNYTAPASTNPTNLYQMNPVWVAGTITATGADAQAYVITDPTVMFNIQADNAAALPGTGAGSIIGATASVAPLPGFPIVGNPWGGNITTGQSGMSLLSGNVNGGASNPTNNSIQPFVPAVNAQLVGNQLPLKIRGVVQVPGNTLSSAGEKMTGRGAVAGIPYVNLIVSLNNSVYNTGQIGV